MTAIDGRRAAVARVGRAASTHAGLWLDKYLRVLAAESESDKNALRDLLLDAVGTSVPEGYAEAVRRREEALRTLDGGVEGGVTLVWTAESDGRMVIGIGAQSIRETNLALLHTWGVPYIPGSALKGLAAATAHMEGESDAWRKAIGEAPAGGDHRRMFGDQESAGLVVFHDAWWLPEGSSLPLDLDVIAVHHPEYYGGGKAVPADWDEPTPVAFLTARGKYMVALSGPKAWVERASEWLEFGLAKRGIGAKTHAGYGRMKLVRRRSDKEKRRDELMALADQHISASTAKQYIQTLRQALEEGLEEAVVAAARALYERNPRFWSDWLADPRRTPEERAFAKRVGMQPATTATAPVPAEPSAPKPAMPAQWVAATAWIERDRKNRPVVYVCSPEKSGERQRKDVTIEPADLVSALEQASKAAPVQVQAQFERNRLVALKAR